MGAKGQPKTGGGSRKGVRNSLPLGAVGALKALRHRVPEGTDPEVAKVADEAFGTLVDVMRGRISGRNVAARLTAARLVRDEVAGPQVLKVQHTTAEQHAEVVFVVEARERERRERARLETLGASVTGDRSAALPAQNPAAKNGA